MGSRNIYCFGPYRLDPGRRILTRGGYPLTITPKAFDVLVALIRRRGDVAGREDLLREVWPDSIVEEATVSQHVFLLRKLLRVTAGDEPLIVTVPRRGYRFVARVYEAADEDTGSLPIVRGADPPGAPIVGRHREFEELRQALAGAVNGHSLLACVTGEAGVGKTSLVDSFIREEAETTADVCVARSRCSERFGESDTYLPVIDLLGDLRRRYGPAISTILKARAPGWYAHVDPGGADPHGFPVRSPDHLKRELCLFLEEISREMTLVSFIDDWHWAGPSTVEVLAYIAGHFDSMRLLFVVTYRPADLALNNPAFVPLKLDLQTRSMCHELPLPPLAEADVECYVRRELEPAAPPEGLAGFVYHLTEGNPLFMVDLLSHLRTQQLLIKTDAGWQLSQRLIELRHRLPESTRSMVQRTLAQLSEANLTLLTESSVQGHEFDSAIVADARGVNVASIEDQLETLSRGGQVISKVADRDLPDGTVNTVYGFTHVLYQNSLFDSLSATRRATWSGRIAQAVLDHHPSHARVAARVAILYEAAHDAPRAVRYFLMAAQHAARMSAFPEAIRLARRGLALVRSVPQSRETAQSELLLLLTLGAALGAHDGYGSLEVRRTYSRAFRLLGSVGSSTSAVPTLFGLWSFHGLRGDMRRQSRVSKQLLHVAAASGDQSLIARVSAAHGGNLLHRGKLHAGRTLLEGALASEHDEPSGSMFVLDGRVHGLSSLAEALALLGYSDQAVSRADEATQLARASGSPYSLAFALTFSGVVHRHRGDAPRTRACADEAVELTTEHEISDGLAWASALQAWGLCHDGRVSEGIRRMQEVMEIQRRMARNPQYFLGTFAETLLTGNLFQEALTYTNSAIAAGAKSGDAYCLPELFWLKGRILTATADDSGAEECFIKSIQLASRQGAQTIKLRAMTSLCRLLTGRPDQGAAARDARRKLSVVYADFTEGHDSRYMKDARETLSA